MATRNNIGARIYVSPAVPATNTAAGFEALSWTEADYPLTLPQLAITHNMIDVPDLKSGFTKGIKGAASGVDTQTTFRIDDGNRNDAGQTIVRNQANDAEGLLSVKIVKGSGVDGAPVAGDPVQYAQGVVHSYQENQKTDTSYEGFQVSFRQNEPTVNATEPSA